VGRRGQRARAEELFIQATDRLEKLVHDFPQRLLYQHDLAACYGRRAKILFAADRRRLPEVQQMLQKSCAMLESLSASHELGSRACTELNLHRKWLEDIARTADARQRPATTAGL
jgi:hypothetical protein